MLLKVESNGGGAQSAIGININLAAKSWTLAQDPAGKWSRISQSKQGRIDHWTQNSIRLRDSFTDILVLFNAPRSENDVITQKREGQILGAVDRTMKYQKVFWSVGGGVGAPPVIAPPTQLPAVQAAAVMTPFRMHLLQRLQVLLPATYLSENYEVIAPGLRRDSPATTGGPGIYSSCGSLPGFVTSEMATFKGYRLGIRKQYMERYSLNGTNVVRIKGMRYGCWVENDGSKPPTPGDVYALLNRGATDKKAAGISHVGVIQEINGNNWKTMDFGQGSGFDGKKDVVREYKPDTFELTGEVTQGRGFRVLAGWVNVDDYLRLSI